MIKLFNKSSYDSTALKALLKYAEKRMQIRGTTAVKITEGKKTVEPHGHAFRGFPYMWHLTTLRLKNPERRTSIPRGLNSGWVTIVLPAVKELVSMVRQGKEDIARQVAEKLLDTAKHEFGHIKDFRSGTHFVTKRNRAGRRQRWGKRPVEISAQNHVFDRQERTANEKRRREAVVFVFAAYLSELLKKEGGGFHEHCPGPSGLAAPEEDRRSCEVLSSPADKAGRHVQNAGA